MAVKEIPINLRTYYSSMKTAYTQLRADAIESIQELTTVSEELWVSVKNNANKIRDEFGINIFEYEEFKENVYTTGAFLKLARGLFLNRRNNYELVADLFDLLSLAKRQKEIYNLTNDIVFYDKILSLSFKEYTNIIRIFYTEVHKRLILKGEGYVFEGSLGWTCINRCHLVNVKPHIDYAATKKRKAELLAEGKRIYNREEAEWCKQNGIDYEAEDCRVFQKIEYCYEIPLIGCKLPNGMKYKLVPSDYRGREVRGFTNDELIEKCDNDINKICELTLDLRTKVSLCNKVDKMLYLNFIRNENQTPINATKINRQN